MDQPYIIPFVSATVGLWLGLIRGSRKASLRFLAENAHRQPRTVQGWYFYNKTKNYRVLLGGLKEGAKESVKLGTIGGAWVGMVEGIRWTGWPEIAEVGAGVGTSAAFATIYRLPLRSAKKVIGLGLIVGGVGSLVGYAKDAVRQRL